MLIFLTFILRLFCLQKALYFKAQMKLFIILEPQLAIVECCVEQQVAITLLDADSGAGRNCRLASFRLSINCSKQLWVCTTGRIGFQNEFTTSIPDDHFLSPKPKSCSFDINSRWQNTHQMQSDSSFTFSRMLEIKSLLQSLLLQPKIVSNPFLKRYKQVVKGIFEILLTGAKAQMVIKRTAMLIKKIQILFCLFLIKNECPWQKYGEALF